MSTTSGIANGVCPYPIGPAHSVLSALSYLDRYNFNGFQPYQRVKFVCRAGYKNTKGSMWSICLVSGRWYPDTQKTGVCTREIRTRPVQCMKQFKCRKDLQCIDRKLRCDCKPDCRDGTDEIGCKNPKNFIFATSASNAKSGVLTSPNFPFGYPKTDFRCTFKFFAAANKRIEVKFEEFSLRENVDGKCMDFIRLNGMSDAMIDKDRIVRCGKDSFKTVISNSSDLEIQVKLDGVKERQTLKGYSLTWKVISNVEAKMFIDKMEVKKLLKKKENKAKQTFDQGGADEVDRGKHEKKMNDNILNVLIPICISAVLPLSVISFVCYHMKYRQRHMTGSKGNEVNEIKDKERNELMDVKKEDDGFVLRQIDSPLVRMNKYRNEKGIVMVRKEVEGNKSSSSSPCGQGSERDMGHSSDRLNGYRTSECRASDIVIGHGASDKLSEVSGNASGLHGNHIGMVVEDFDTMNWMNMQRHQMRIQFNDQICTTELCGVCNYHNNDDENAMKQRDCKAYSSDSGTFTGNDLLHICDESCMLRNTERKNRSMDNYHDDYCDYFSSYTGTESHPCYSDNYLRSKTRVSRKARRHVELKHHPVNKSELTSSHDAFYRKGLSGEFPGRRSLDLIRSNMDKERRRDIQSSIENEEFSSDYYQSDDYSDICECKNCLRGMKMNDINQQIRSEGRSFKQNGKHTSLDKYKWDEPYYQPAFNIN
eukprot:gene19488-21413_t